MGEREINSGKERRYCRVWDFSAYLLSNKNKDNKSLFFFIAKAKSNFFTIRAWISLYMSKVWF